MKNKNKDNKSVAAFKTKTSVLYSMQTSYTHKRVRKKDLHQHQYCDTHAGALHSKLLVGKGCEWEQKMQQPLLVNFWRERGHQGNILNTGQTPDARPLVLVI